MADKKATKKTPVNVAAKIAQKESGKVDYMKMSETDLLQAIKQLREEVVTLKRGTISGEVQNVRAYGARRKELARALTARNTVKEEK